MKLRISYQKVVAAVAVLFAAMLLSTTLRAANLQESVGAVGETVQPASKEVRKPVKQTLRGYKFFVEAGYSWDAFEVGGTDEVVIGGASKGKLTFGSKAEFSTSHGFQFNDYLFAGGGLSVCYFPDRKGVNVPVFGNVRVNFLNKPITPFVDVKAGYAFGEFAGFYGDFGLGLRVGLKNRHAVYGSFVLTGQGNKGHKNQENRPTGNIGFKVGFEF